MTVNGNLDLSNKLIEVLPDNLTVHGNLDLRGSKIEKIPVNLCVDGNIYLSKRLTKKAIENMFKNSLVNGEIHLSYVDKVKSDILNN